MKHSLRSWLWRVSIHQEVDEEIGAGVLIGLILASLLAQSIATFLFGVRPVDPLTFGMVIIVLGITAALASAVPALRAARVDPVEAFRSE